MKFLSQVDPSQWWRFTVGIACALAFWLLTLAQFLPLSLRVLGMWGLWLLVPGAMVRAGAWWDGVSAMGRVGSLLLVSSAWNLLVLYGVQLAGGTLHLGLLVLSASWPLLAFVPAPRGCPRLKVPWRGGILVLAFFGILLIHLTRQTPQLRLDSDVPAHLGTIHDALQQDRYLPLDTSFPDAPAARDPRMGLLHGTHAALAQALGAHPARVWGLGGGVLCLGFLVCFAWLFTEWGLSSPLALLAAVLFALGVGGGAPLGIWGAVYPAQFALGLAAASGALFLRASREARGEKVWWIGAAALGLSVLVHPFAWWGMCLVMAHLLLLSALLRHPPSQILRIARYLGLAALAGGALALPLLLGGAGSSGQWEQAGILRFGHGLFTIDPLIVVRWSGALSLVVILFACWRWRHWKQNLPGLFVVASVLPVWTVTFDPLVQPFVFSHAGYLSERLGLFAAAPAVLFLALLPKRGRDWGLPRRILAGALVAGLFVIAWPKLESSPYRAGADVPAHLAEVREAVGAVHGPVLTDPRTSYALRGMGGGAFTILPVAHASPLDRSIETRTAWYRTILARDCSPEQFEHARNELGASALLLMDRVEAEYGGKREYGFVASDRRQQELRRRLEEAGFTPRAQGKNWALFDCKGLGVRARTDRTDATLCGEQEPSTKERGKELELMSLEFTPGHASPGDSLEVRLCYSAGGDSIANRGWSRVQLRFLGPHEPVPKLFLKVSKLYRKLIQEKSLRSRSRFTVSFLPNDGYPRNEAVWGEFRTVAIPSWVKAGRYGVLARVEAEEWRPVRSVADYLDDRARWSGASWGEVILQPAEGMR